MNVLDLFSGIGGFSLGLERAGMRTVAFCEIDPFCRRVLAKHWPKVPIYDDVKNITATKLRLDGIDVDVICGGFPCQDISSAGSKRGLVGSRSGLWSEYARIVCEVRPRYVIVENVADLLARGIGDVLGDLAAIGYDSEWHCIPACTVGAPFMGEGRDRVWIVAYANGYGCDRARISRKVVGKLVAGVAWGRSAFDGLSSSAPDHWNVEPDVGRVANGVPERVDRIRSLGNAAVPQIPELIGKAIMEIRAGNAIDAQQDRSA